MFVEIPPHIAVSYFMQRVKGRSSRKIQQEFPELRKRYWQQAATLRTTSYSSTSISIQNPIDRLPPTTEPTGASR
jgi:putative transposase